MVSWIVLGLPTVNMLAAAGCTTFAPAPALADAEIDLRGRVETYWLARQNSDLAAAYESYSPEFRKITPRPVFLRDYQRLIRFPPDRVQIEGIEFGDALREAQVKVRLKLTREIEGKPILFDGVTTESWTYVDGKWWKKDEPLRPNI